MKVDIIGRGNVGTHLMSAMSSKCDAAIVNPRTLKGLRNNCDIYLISVSDDAIADVASRLLSFISQEAIVAHTSGTTPLSILSDLYSIRGVFYPLQTFTKGKDLQYNEIPFFVESNKSKGEEKLCELARLISNNVRIIDSEQRKALHIASVFSCNFVNHLWALSDSYLKEHGLSIEMLYPLIEETAKKVKELPPYYSQTGPARRHDMKTINEHIYSLGKDKNLKEIYSQLTNSILSKYNNI